MTNKQAYAGLLEEFRSAKANGDPEKYVHVISVATAHRTAEAISSLLKRVDRLEAASRNARAWVFECWGWLMETDLDMECPMEVDPLDIVEQFDALLGIDAALNSDAPLSIGEGL